jgi:dsRNA-specific ribonuclease
MKIRTSFVANSSSSSFIIAIKNLDVQLQDQPEWVQKLINRHLSLITQDGVMIKTEKQLQEYLVEHWGYDDFEELVKEEGKEIKKKYEKMLKIITDGYILSDINVDYSDEWKSTFFESLPKKDDGSGMFLVESNC